MSAGRRFAQKALDNRCGNEVCAVLKKQTPEEAVACVKEQDVKEPIEGWLSSLPGNMTINA